MQQLKLKKYQIKAFYKNHHTKNQVDHFMQLLKNKKSNNKYIVDIGGGCGFFARLLHLKTGYRIRVIDSDKESINQVTNIKNKNISGVLGNALKPKIYGDENIVCFNLILHHLIADDEKKTKYLQKKALMAWKNNADFIFINEYIYDSFFKDLSGRLIFEITKNITLSRIGKVISRIIPSLRANTFGVGVRFRSHNEWINLFEECGFSVVSKIYNKPEYISLPRRLLFIKQVRRDSFLLS
jgi:hypothetical protein